MKFLFYRQEQTNNYTAYRVARIESKPCRQFLISKEVGVHSSFTPWQWSAGKVDFLLDSRSCLVIAEIFINT